MYSYLVNSFSFTVKYVQISVHWECKRRAQLSILECLIIEVKSLLMENEIRR